MTATVFGPARRDAPVAGRMATATRQQRDHRRGGTGHSQQPFRTGTGGRREPSAVARGGHLAASGARRRLQRGILLQDRALQLLQCLAWFDAELLRQHPPRLLVDGQRICLPPAPVQRDHQLLVQALAQRIGGHQGLQLTDDMRVTPEREIGLDPVFHHAGP